MYVYTFLYTIVRRYMDYTRGITLSTNSSGLWKLLKNCALKGAMKVSGDIALHNVGKINTRHGQQTVGKILLSKLFLDS